MPTDFVKQHIFSDILSKITIKIDKLDIATNTLTTKYIGNITGIAMQGDTAVVNLEAKDKSLGFNVPRLVYQSTCNNDLFDTHCEVIAANYSNIITITSVSGSTITASDFANKPDGYYTLGYVQYQGEYRFITNHVGSTLTMLTPFGEDVTGKAIVAYAGCNKSAPVCVSKFNNIDNFLGFAYIPSKNPSLWGLE